MNINYNQKKLNESQNIDISPTQFADLNSVGDSAEAEKYQKVFEKDSNLFKFSNGSVMANITNTEIDNKFSLRWHADNAKNMAEFFQSVSKFIDSDLSEQDKTRLTKLYNQLYPEF